METQYTVYRKSAKVRIAIAALLSVLVHVGFVAGAKLLPTRQPPATVQDEGDVQIGDPDVAELVVPYDQPEETPPPDEPTPPPEETPEPEETPPPVEDMTFAEPTPEATPEKPKPKPAAPKFTGPIPPNAKRGPVYVPGVVGGNPNGTKPTGTPGAGNVGWRTPHPPYPAQAKAMRAQGETSVTITTDASGNVSGVTITKSAGAILDNYTKSYVRSNWKGPPNATHPTTFSYVLK